MGSVTLAQFQSEIIAGLGNRGDVTLDRIVTALNMKQSRLSRAYDFQEMSATPVGTLTTGNPTVDKNYTLPTLTKTIHAIVLVDNTSAGALWSSRKMTEKPWRWFDKNFPVPEVLPPEWPSVYTRWGNVITMAPPPQAAYQIRLRTTVWPTPFVSTNLNQTSDFDNKDDILLHDTMGYFWRSFGRVDQAQWHEQVVEQLVKEAIDKEDTRPDMDVSLDVQSADLTTQYWNNAFITGLP